MRIKKCLVAKLEPGMSLACPMVKENGQLMLAEGTVLTDSIIERLKYTDISFLHILEKKEERLRLSNVKDFNPAYTDTLHVIKSCFSTTRYFKEVPLNQMRELIDTSIDPLIHAMGVIDFLQTIRQQDDYTFHHSLNVAIIAGVLGKWLGLSGASLKNVILTGLLHDIGKTQIPLEILNKPGKLTPAEMESMKQHSREGYNILLTADGIDDEILSGVLQHHERNDGSGYPQGIRDKSIHLFAKIVAVADIYDAMTSDRVYCKKRTPFDVVEMISREMLGKLDPRVCVIFLNNVSDYFVGTQVRLSDGREAQVICRGRCHASRPTVRTQDGEFVDLEKSKELGIIELVEN